MKIARGLFLSCVGSVLLSSAAFGLSFEKEDALFAKRADGFRAATVARSAYAKTLNSFLTQNEKVYAVSQMARLDIYRGAMLPNIELRDRKKIFEDCVDTMESLRETKSQEFYYFHLSCVAFRGKLSSTMGRIKWALKLRKIQKEALKSLEGKVAYEGGGILRVLSAVRGNRKAKALGLYNPTEALSFSTTALATEKVVVKPYPAKLSGQDYHENYYYVGQAEVALGVEKSNIEQVKKGLTTVHEAMTRVDALEKEKNLPQGREPETRYYRSLMTELSSKIKSCLTERRWKSCLIKKLS